MRPRLLDIGCCQGSSSYGYVQAGWDVKGNDIVPQPRYPYAFILADGLDLLADRSFMSQFDGVHMSWPCQGYTNCQRIQGREHPQLVDQGRELVLRTGLPYVMENVIGAPMINPIMLCGSMFGLHTYRHRLFESNVALHAPKHPVHTSRQIKMGRPVRDGEYYQAVGNFSNVSYVRRDLGLHWMNRDGLRESFPWQYAQHAGAQLIRHLVTGGVRS